MPSQKPTDPIAQVRERAAMYVGSTGSEGCFQILLELVANAVDQFLQGFATKLQVKTSGLHIEVYDDGKGFPAGDPRIVRGLTNFHDTATLDGHSPHIHLCLRGVGLYPVNALSESFKLETVYQQTSYRYRYEKGQLVTQESDVELDFHRGTRVTSDIDPEIFLLEVLDQPSVRRMLFQTAHLFPGLSVEWNDERFFSDDGLIDMLDILEPEPKTTVYARYNKRFGFTGQTERIQFNVAASGESHSNLTIRSWVNGVPTPTHGSHVSGTLKALANADWTPKTLLVSIVFSEPEWAGPTRDKLRTPWVIDEVAALLSSPLASFLA